MQLTLMYFSPTGTTKKIVAAVGKKFFENMLSKTQIVDLTPLAARLRSYAFGEEDVVIFGAPVYGGRVPPILKNIFENMQGNGARAVAISVYGNRDYDDALLETCDLLGERGFRVCAAGAFIGEHSYSALVGAGRPDAEDLLAATTFAIAAYEKVVNGAPIGKPVRGNRPYRELSASMLAPKKAPVFDAEKCVHCRKCVSVCPVCNIKADLSDCGRCIACAACVKGCPKGARFFDDEGVLAARARLEANCTERRSPKFFL